MAREAVIRLDVEAGDAEARIERLGGTLEELGIESVEAGEKFERIEDAAVEMSQGVERSADMAAQEVQEMGQAAERAGSQMQSMNRAGGSANQVLFNLGDITQDAQFGMKGVANNVPLLIEQFGRLKTSAGGTGSALKTLVGSLAGAGGLVLAVNAVMAVGPQLVGLFSDTEESASDADEEMSSLFDTASEGTEDIDNLGTALEELDPSASKARAAMRVLENGIRNATEEFRLLRTLLQQEEGLGAVLMEGLRQAVPGLRVAQAELEVAEVAETTDRLREVLNRTDESARVARLALASLGADVETIMEGPIREARGEVASLGDELETVFGGGAEGLLDEAPGAVAEELTRSVDELQRRLQQRQQAGLAEQEDVLQKQVSFLEDSLTQISDEFEDPQRFQAAFEPLLNRLERLRQRLQGIGEETQEVGEVVGGVQSILNEQQVRGFLRRERQRSPARRGMGPRFGLPSQGQLQRGMMQQQRMSMQFGQASADRQAIADAQRAAEEMGLFGDTLTEQFNKMGEVQDDNNQKIAQGISLAADLGATMAQAAQGAETEWNRVLGQILSSVGSALALAGQPVAGAALAGGGTLIGSFQHGGKSLGGAAVVGETGPEIVNLPRGARVHSNQESRRMMDTSAVESRLKNVESKMDTFINVLADKPTGFTDREALEAARRANLRMAEENGTSVLTEPAFDS